MAKHTDFFKLFASVLVALTAMSGVDAAVVKRTATAKAATARTPVVTKSTQSEAVSTSEAEDTVEVQEEVFEFENRSGQFDTALDGAASGTDAQGDELSDMIRKQKAAADTSAATGAVKSAARVSTASGQNACDLGLRKCMQAKCGADFAKCAGDTDTIWGDKMDSCRSDLDCSGAEYAAFVPEIKADRDANAELANFNAIIDCGNKYNSCIVAECGTTFSKCLGKSAGDAAIAKCKKIQTECAGLDNGLASRMMNVFAGVRQDAEKQVLRDEQRLYDLRDEMESVCRRMGALFDQRSLDCVYTVNFFADNSSTPYASKKAYAGGVFNCDPGWFGIDVTTFKENAYRLTRAQTSASSAMLGSGVGMAVGAVTSGAIDRALETQEANKELKKAQEGDKADKEEKEIKDKGNKTDDSADKKEEQSVRQAEREANKAAREKRSAERKKDNKADNRVIGESEEEIVEDYGFNSTQVVCENKGGTWKDNICSCKNAKGRNITTKNPVNDCVKAEKKVMKGMD